MEVKSRSLDDWNRIVHSAFSGCDVEAGDTVFPARLAQCDMDGFRFSFIDARKSRVQRWKNRSAPRGGSGHLLLHVQVAGTWGFSQGGRDVALMPGDTAFCNPDAAYQIDFHEAYKAFVLEVPADRIAAAHLAFDVEEAGGRVMNRTRSAMLVAYLKSVWAQKPYLDMQRDWRDAVGRAGMELALSAIGEAFSLKEHPVSSQLTVSVLAHVHSNLRDPQLRTSTIAKALGISRKSVQTVFERMATTASAYILERRLRLAADELRSRRTRGSITETAYGVGFSDSAYFSRCFHRRFGCVPRAY